jgi:hypothetical protein
MDTAPIIWIPAMKADRSTASSATGRKAGDKDRDTRHGRCRYTPFPDPVEIVPILSDHDFENLPKLTGLKSDSVIGFIPES